MNFDSFGDRTNTTTVEFKQGNTRVHVILTESRGPILAPHLICALSGRNLAGEPEGIVVYIQFLKPTGMTFGKPLRVLKSVFDARGSPEAAVVELMRGLSDFRNRFNRLAAEAERFNLSLVVESW